MDPQDAIDSIREWAKNNRWFDMSFVEALEESLYERGELSGRQQEALENIVDRFNIRT